MLDNTLILWCNELSRGNVHSHPHMPFVLAGGAGGAAEPGRFLQYSTSVKHNDLLVSCVNVCRRPRHDVRQSGLLHRPAGEALIRRPPAPLLPIASSRLRGEG